ncbi:MAG: phosphatase PAP2 family protein [Candidatus Eisenbacteria bacterium]
MVEAADNPVVELERKLDDKIVAPPTRRHRAAAFQLYLLIGSGVFIALAIVARTVAYFPFDLKITRAVQSYHGILFDRLMSGLSWIGFFPQVAVLGAVVIVVLFIAGLRWEAVATLFASCGVAIGSLVKLMVVRPRPSADLVDVIRVIGASSFPSGHVLMFTTFCGFLGFLVFTLIKKSWARTIMLILLASIIVLMGLSRIYQGHHWFSDVMGAHLLGSLWLAITVKLYRWGKPRFFSHQPVVPPAPGHGT